MNENPLAQEITAQIQLGLAGTVGKLAKQLRAIDKLAPKLKEGGIVRKLTIDRNVRRRAVGISVANRRIEAFGGLLYAVAAVAHELTTEGADIAHSGQESRLDVGDMDLLEFERRIEWKSYHLVYDLLEELFDGGDLPDVIMLDIPLIMGRDVYPQIVDSSDSRRNKYMQDEIDKLKIRVEGFWQKHVSNVFPFDPNGPRVVTLNRGRLSGVLRLIEKQGQDISPDPIDSELEEMIQTNYSKMLSVGTERLIKGVLMPEYRTAAIERDNSTSDKRPFPRSLIERGTIGFHYLCGLRGRPVQVETLGSAAEWHSQGGSQALDDLAADLTALTYFDNVKALPLPFWYAQQTVEVVKKKGLLEFYKREALRNMQEEQVDQAWLAGWESE